MLRSANVVGLFKTAATEATEAAEAADVAGGGATVVAAGELSLSAVTVVAVVDEEPAARTRSSMQFKS